MKGVPASPKSCIDRCMKVLGEAGIELMIAKQTPPSFILHCDVLFGCLDKYSLTEGLTRREVGFWMIRNNMTTAVHTIMRISPTKKVASKIATRIRHNETFVVADVLPREMSR